MGPRRIRMVWEIGILRCASSSSTRSTFPTASCGGPLLTPSLLPFLAHSSQAVAVGNRVVHYNEKTMVSTTNNNTSSSAASASSASSSSSSTHHHNHANYRAAAHLKQAAAAAGHHSAAATTTTPTTTTPAPPTHRNLHSCSGVHHAHSSAAWALDSTRSSASEAGSETSGQFNERHILGDLLSRRAALDRRVERTAASFITAALAENAGASQPQPPLYHAIDAGSAAAAEAGCYTTTRAFEQQHEPKQQ